MTTIEILLAGPLAGLATGDFRGAARRADGGLCIERRLAASTSLKDAVEAVGVPHCEIGAIEVIDPDGSRARLRPDALLRELDAERLVVEVHPPRPTAVDSPRFLCDRHLGKLARRLRQLGFDTHWRGDPAGSDEELVRIHAEEGRIVLSGCRALLKRREIGRAQLVRSSEPLEQVAEVLRRWRLAGRVRWFGRCSRCNGPIDAVAKAEVADRIPPRTALWLDEYFLCRNCGQLYWEGTHVQKLTQRLREIVARCGEDDGDR